MKPRERIRFIATIDTLKRVAEDYPGKTIENIIAQMEARKKEVEKKMKELEDLKVGDNVIVGGAYSYCRIRQVEKVTKKHIMVEGNKFSKEFGWIDGCSSYTSDHIRPATEEDIRRVEEEEEKRGIIKWLGNTRFEKLSYETLVAIRDIVEKEIGNSAAKQ